MSSKTMRYVLIAGVVFIWGTILYKVISAMSDNTVLPVQSNPVVTPIANLKQEDFYLFANYPDPFIPEENIDTIPVKATTVASVAPSSSITPPIPPKPDVNFIQYHGCILNSEKKVKIGLISFRGTDLLIREKDKREEVLFRKIYPDRIEVIYKGQLFTINKN